jgi:hypothetical protein
MGIGIDFRVEMSSEELGNGLVENLPGKIPYVFVVKTLLW